MSNRRRYPEGEIRRLVEVEGYTDKKLAEHFGVSVIAAGAARQRAGVRALSSRANHVVYPEGEIEYLVHSLGYTDAQLAKHYGITPISAEKARLRHRVLRQKPHLSVAPEAKARMESLLDEGYSYAGVAEIMNSTPRTVANHFPGRGFTREQANEASSLAQKARWAMDKLGNGGLRV